MYVKYTGQLLVADAFSDERLIGSVRTSAHVIISTVHVQGTLVLNSCSS